MKSSQVGKRLRRSLLNPCAGMYLSMTLISSYNISQCLVTVPLNNGEENHHDEGSTT